MSDAQPTPERVLPPALDSHGWGDRLVLIGCGLFVLSGGIFLASARVSTDQLFGFWQMIFMMLAGANVGQRAAGAYALKHIEGETP